MAGAIESLNVSVAAGICLYEAVRQRRGGCYNPSNEASVGPATEGAAAALF